jgi:hypothetical protein
VAHAKSMLTNSLFPIVSFSMCIHLVCVDRLVVNTEGLPRPRKDDIVADTVNEDHKPKDGPGQFVGQSIVQ